MRKEGNAVHSLGLQIPARAFGFHVVLMKNYCVFDVYSNFDTDMLR